jgi:TolA-binding protein
LIYTKHDLEALAILRQLLPASSVGEQSSLLHYWAGECCWNLGLFEEANEQFSHAAKSPEFAKAELATFKLALIADKYSDASCCRKLLLQLLHDFPDGDCVVIAKPLLVRYGMN